ncbi:hypothetical protein NYZ21_21405, partial [Acinetobacter baumannii]|nr:hypothetical protein [Acinetobacter baumannii]
RLAKIAQHLGLPERAAYWRAHADRMHRVIVEAAFNAQRGHFVDAFGGERLDASLLLLADLGFVAPHDPRFVATVEAIGRDLRRGNGLFR